MNDFDQQNPIDDNDFFNKTIEEDEGSGMLKTAILVLFVLALIIGGYFLFFSGDKDESLSTETTEKTTDVTTINDTITNNVALDTIENTGDVAVDNAQNVSADTINSNNEVYESNNNSNTTANADNHYFIVSGVFSVEANAQRKVDALVNAGYEAIIVGKNMSGLFVVAYEGFATMEEAKTKFNEIRAVQDDVWIYKK